MTFFVRRLLCWKCMCDIYLSMLDFNGSCKFNNIFTNKITTADLCNYNGRQIKCFNLKWFNCELINRVWVDVFVKWLRLVLVYRRSYKFNNNLRTSKQTKIYHLSNVFNVVYQQRIWTVFLFNSKLNDCAEWSKRAGRISK